MGWSASLKDEMELPFQVQCREECEVSPLEGGETVRVVGMRSRALSSSAVRTDRMKQPRAR